MYLLVEGFLFLYNKQQEQQKHETKVMIIMAADAPTSTPIKTVKLKSKKFSNLFHFLNKSKKVKIINNLICYKG